jgi:hypothetical protein
MAESTFDKALKARRTLVKAKAAYEKAQQAHEQALTKAIDELCANYRNALAADEIPPANERLDIQLHMLTGKPCQDACAQVWPVGSPGYNNCLLVNYCTDQK